MATARTSEAAIRRMAAHWERASRPPASPVRSWVVRRRRRVDRPRHVPHTGRAGGTCPDVPSDLPAGPDRESEGDEPTEGVQDPAHAHGDPPFHDRLYTFHFAPAAIKSEANVAPESRMRLIFARIEPPPSGVFPIRRVGYIGRGDGMSVGWGDAHPSPGGHPRVGRKM